MVIFHRHSYVGLPEDRSYYIYTGGTSCTDKYFYPSHSSGILHGLLERWEITIQPDVFFVFIGKSSPEKWPQDCSDIIKLTGALEHEWIIFPIILRMS